MSGQGDAHANKGSKVEKESDASIRESRGVGWVGQQNEHTSAVWRHYSVHKLTVSKRKLRNDDWKC